MAKFGCAPLPAAADCPALRPPCRHVVSRERDLLRVVMHAVACPAAHTACADAPAAPPLSGSTLAALTLSVASSVSLVIVNKYLISTLMFPYGARLPTPRVCAPVLALTFRAWQPCSCAPVTTLTAAHLFVTALGLDAGAKCLNMFEPKAVEWRCACARGGARRDRGLPRPTRSRRCCAATQAASAVRRHERPQRRLPQPVARVQQRGVRRDNPRASGAAA